MKFSDHKNIISVIFGLDPDEVFFIRNCYKKLAKEIFSNKHNQNRVLLSGTPGIGKTLFGLYWIWYLLHQPPANRDIRFFIEMKGKICLEVYRKDENWTVGYSSRDEFARIIIKKEDEIYAVMDNCESFVELYGREKIHQVLIMSPGRTNMIKISQTDRIMKIYLPLWIDDELRSYCKNVNKNYEDLNKKEIPKKNNN